MIGFMDFKNLRNKIQLKDSKHHGEIAFIINWILLSVKLSDSTGIATMLFIFIVFLRNIEDETKL
jgi:hypothetical protein